MTTDLLEKDDIKDDLEDYKGKWKNLAFLHNGESDYGLKVYNSEEDARAKFDNFMKGSNSHAMLENSFVHKDFIQYVVPMPIGE